MLALFSLYMGMATLLKLQIFSDRFLSPVCLLQCSNNISVHSSSKQNEQLFQAKVDDGEDLNYSMNVQTVATDFEERVATVFLPCLAVA